MLSATPIKSEKAVNDLLELAKMINQPDTFKKRMSELKKLQTETNEALDKLTQAKSIDELMQSAKQQKRLAEKKTKDAEKEATKLLNDAKNKAQEQLSAANEHAKQVMHQHDALLAEAKKIREDAEALLTEAEEKAKIIADRQQQVEKTYDQAKSLRTEYQTKVEKLKGSLSALI